MERQMDSTRRGLAQVAGAAGLITLGGLWTPALAAERRSANKQTNGAAHEEAILRKAQARVEELVAAYRRPQADPDTLARLRAVIERARKSLP